MPFVVLRGFALRYLVIGIWFPSSGGIDSTGCKLGALEKARFRKGHFSGHFLWVFDSLRSACSLRIPPENLYIQ